MYRNTPLGDKFRARFKFVNMEQVTTSFLPGGQCIQVAMWAPEDLAGVVAQFGLAPGIQDVVRNFWNYRVRNWTVKTTFFPNLAEFANTGNEMHMVEQGSSGGDTQIVTTSTYDELKENSKVRLVPIGGAGIYKAPPKCLHKWNTEKVLRDRHMALDKDFTGATNPTVAIPWFTAPADSTVAQSWVVTSLPTGFPGGNTPLGYMRHELYYSVDFYGRKDVVD